MLVLVPLLHCEENIKPLRSVNVLNKQSVTHFKLFRPTQVGDTFNYMTTVTDNLQIVCNKIQMLGDDQQEAL